MVVAARALCITSAEIASLASVLALGSALGVDHARLVNVTVLVRSADELLRADVVEAILEVGAAGVATAGRLAHSLDTQLIPEAVAVARAHGAAHSSITHRSTGTLLVRAAVRHGHTSQERIASGSRTARAHRLVVIVHTLGILSADIGQSTRIDTDRVQTGLGHGAVVIVRALDSSALHMRITASITGTSTGGRMLGSNALCIASTGILDATGILALGIDASRRAGTVRVRVTLLRSSTATQNRVSN